MLNAAKNYTWYNGKQAFSAGIRARVAAGISGVIAPETAAAASFG